MDKNPCFSCATCNFLTYDPYRLKTHIGIKHPGNSPEFFRQIISKLSSDRIKQADALFHSLLECSVKEYRISDEEKDPCSEDSWLDTQHMVADRKYQQFGVGSESTSSGSDTDVVQDTEAKDLSRENDLVDEFYTDDLFPVRIVCNISNQLMSQSETQPDNELSQEANRPGTNLSEDLESGTSASIYDQSKYKGAADTDPEINGGLTRSPSLTESPHSPDVSIHEAVDQNVYDGETLNDWKEVKREHGLSESLLVAYPVMEYGSCISKTTNESFVSENKNLEAETDFSNEVVISKDIVQDNNGQTVDESQLKMFANGKHLQGINGEQNDQIHNLTKKLLPKVIVKKLNDSFLENYRQETRVKSLKTWREMGVKDCRVLLQRNDALLQQWRATSTTATLPTCDVKTYSTSKRPKSKNDEESNWREEQLEDRKPKKAVSDLIHTGKVNYLELSDYSSDHGKSIDESLDKRFVGNNDYHIEYDEDSDEFESEGKMSSGHKKKSRVCVKKSSPYFCKVCNRKFAPCLGMKHHCVQRHSKSLLAFNKNNQQTIHFCPKDCHFFTSNPATLLGHVVVCERPEIPSSNNCGHHEDVQKNFQERTKSDITTNSIEVGSLDGSFKARSQVVIKMCDTDGLVISTRGKRKRPPLKISMK